MTTDQVLLKCYLGSEICMFYVSSTIGFDELHRVLEDKFNTKGIQIVKYEDHEGDRINVNSKVDIEHAFSIYQRIASINPNGINVLKLFLSDGTVPLPSPALQRATGIAVPLSPKPHLPSPLEIPHPPYDLKPHPSSDGEYSEPIALTRVSTPPIRTPPQSPGRDRDREPHVGLARSGSTGGSSDNIRGLSIARNSPPLRRRGATEGSTSIPRPRFTAESLRTSFEEPSFSSTDSSFSVSTIVSSIPTQSPLVQQGRATPPPLAPPIRTPPPSPTLERADRERVRIERERAEREAASLSSGSFSTDSSSASITSITSTPLSAPAGRASAQPQLQLQLQPQPQPQPQPAPRAGPLSPNPGSRINLRLSSSAPTSWTKGQRLGGGGFGEVYLGLTDTGELIAVKQIPIPNDNENLKALVSIEQEIDILKALNHENIVRYLGTERGDGVMNIFLEYVPGGSLSSLLSKFGPFPESVIRSYTRQTLQGLVYLHENKIIHRDIKGANILVDTKGVVKLADFGCSKYLADSNRVQSNNNKTVMGTPFWMAPEVIRGTGHGRSADIWSLGCTIIEMATGRPPFNQFEPQQALFQIAKGVEPDYPSHLSPEGIEFLKSCFQRDPKNRPTSQTLLSYPFVKDTNFISNDHINQLKSMVPVHSLLSSAPFSILSKDLIVNIFSFLDAENLVKVAQVCKHWKSFSEESHLWYNVHYRRWGPLGGGFSSLALDASSPSPPPVTIGGTSHSGLTWRQMYISHDRHDKRWFSSNYTSTLLKGHKKAVYCLRFDDHRIVSGSDDEIRIWDLHSVLQSSSSTSSEKEKKDKSSSKVKKAAKMTGHKGPILCLQFDEKKVVSGGADKTLKVWDLRSRKIVKSLTGHSQAVTCLHYTDLKLVSGSLDKMIKVWDLPSSHLTTTVGGHLEGVTAVHFLDDNKIVTGSIDKTLKIWDLRVDGSTCIRTYEGHKSEVTSIFFQNGRLMSGSKDMTIREWDLRASTSSSSSSPLILGAGGGAGGPASAIARARGGSGGSGSSAVSPGRAIGGSGGSGTTGAGNGNGVLRNDSIEMVSNNSSWVNVLAFDSFKLVSGCQDKTIKLFDSEGSLVRSLEGHQDAILDLQFDGSKIISASKDKTIRIWSFGAGGLGGGLGGSSSSLPLLGTAVSASPAVGVVGGVVSPGVVGAGTGSGSGAGAGAPGGGSGAVGAGAGAGGLANGVLNSPSDSASAGK